MKNVVNTFLLMFSFLLTLSAQTEYGVASYYGTYFHGRPTASGEKYNQFALTAAHKTLPLGTIVKVTNEQNKKSVFVKINDRGPYIKGRIIDLSTKAADLLGYKNKGTTKVKVEIIEEDKTPEDLLEATMDIAKENGIQTYDSTTTVSVMHADSENTTAENVEQTTNMPKSVPPQMPLTEVKDANSNATTNRSSYYIITKLDKSKSGFFGLQLGVFSDMNVLLAIIADLEIKYKQSMLVEQENLSGKIVYKLFMGKFQNRAYADALKSVLADKYADAFVVKYE
ncbi:MAG TPA: septal ring lytic transglycosylase RlpA family protein [Chitinophagales bacterium]|jgi:rare lipoprotein A|nr:septal ring lytic transglycosylase RlpA family protein [Chitinophagales bacterium]HQV78183.1 septal ring lytic transglycosylase RlpA family protein [Chitinophagales bacterium]HQW79380.1 septal ring lytic transglycosylase RlpA family protein [Chitinophagales bacterium]HRB18531.1 septal ring lytic transglycosylase RlpA family protein [Chitinophagales bacterium]HRB66185.1 septal ring lytic transglycosylase RlpA family protein [Chitinophagales bacterium]